MGVAIQMLISEPGDTWDSAGGVVDNQDIRLHPCVWGQIPSDAMHGFRIPSRYGIHGFAIKLSIAGDNDQCDVSLLRTAPSHEKGQRPRGKLESSRGEGTGGPVTLSHSRLLSPLTLVILEGPDPPVSLVTGRLVAVSCARIVAPGWLIVEGIAPGDPTASVACLEVLGEIV